MSTVVDKQAARARSYALEVADLWSAPAAVRSYLETGDLALVDVAFDSLVARYRSYHLAASGDDLHDCARNSPVINAWAAAWAACSIHAKKVATPGEDKEIKAIEAAESAKNLAELALREKKMES